jgi:hypothetical protein
MRESEPKTVPEMLRDAAEIYEQRNTVYGDNYKNFGKWVNGLFPHGIMAFGEHDINRLGVLVQILSKLSRYVQNFGDGGHKDSLDDLVVYVMMLQELDNERRQ